MSQSHPLFMESLHSRTLPSASATWAQRSKQPFADVCCLICDLVSVATVLLVGSPPGHYRSEHLQLPVRVSLSDSGGAAQEKYLWSLVGFDAPRGGSLLVVSPSLNFFFINRTQKFCRGSDGATSS